jgi:hypothetical protein
MGFPTRVAIILAKALLDRLLSPERTNELVKEFTRAYSEWRKKGSPPEPQDEPSDSESTIRKALEELQETGKLTVKVTERDRTNAQDYLGQVEQKLESLPIELVSDPDRVEAAIDEELPGLKNAFMIRLALPELVGTLGPRYFHFSWKTNQNESVSFRLRDYIGKVIYHQPGVRVNESPFTPRSLEMTAQDIWRHSDREDRHPRTGKLRVNADRFDFWSKTLRDMTDGRQPRKESVDEPRQDQPPEADELPGASNAYIIWLTLPRLIGNLGPRYFHFSWERKPDRSVAFRLRDYIGSVIYHQPGVMVNELPFVPQGLEMTAQDIWRHSDPEDRRPRTGELRRSHTNFNYWLPTLRQMTHERLNRGHP